MLTATRGKTAQFLAALIATNLKAALAQRGAFWLQAAFMMANNFIFFTVWWFFFKKFDSINGWRLPDMALLYGVVAGSFGLSVTLAGGMRNLAQVIAEGDLDVFLAQPKSVLPHVVLSRSFPSGWGDLVTSVLLIASSGVVGGVDVPLIALCIVNGALIFVATGVLVHSAAFWLGQVNALARSIVDFLIMFSVYPQNIYTGALRVMMFTIMPAGFIGYLPVETLRAFSAEKLAVLIGASAAYCALALFVFSKGLKQYASGSRFGVRV